MLQTDKSKKGNTPTLLGIIKACISQSGVALSPWVFMEPGMSRQMALNMAKAVGCAENVDLLKCLQSKPIEKVGNVSLMVDVSIVNEIFIRV